MILQEKSHSIIFDLTKKWANTLLSLPKGNISLNRGEAIAGIAGRRLITGIAGGSEGGYSFFFP